MLIDRESDELDAADLEARDKLPFLKSPIMNDGSQRNSLASLPGSRPQSVLGQGLPQFQRHEDAGFLEIFFDLCFAANCTVFSTTQAVTDTQHFKSYVGYFCLLWLTWFLVTLYDVRYVTDSIVARITRAAQLGVMVGYAIVAPKFDPTEQHIPTMKTMSTILAVSRLVLSIEYGCMLWHVRKFKRAHLPFILQIALNFITGAIYLGITFRFHKERSRVFITWYVVAGAEAALTIILSNFWTVLSFTKTHLMKRMSLLTAIILGDGIIILGKNLIKIVKAHNAWTPLTIGLVTAAAAAIYFVFLIYFDWMKRSYLPAWRQQVWTCLHLPFHLCLILFIHGFTQLILWSKIIHIIKTASIRSILDNATALSTATSNDIATDLAKVTGDFFKDYPPQYYSTWVNAKEAIGNITIIPDDFWPKLAEFYTNGGDDRVFPVSMNDAINRFNNATDILTASMHNSLFGTFGIDLLQELSKKAAKKEGHTELAASEVLVSDETWQRYALVFAYTYIATGMLLMLMTILLAVARITTWKPWPLLRSSIYAFLAFGTGLVATLYYNDEARYKFLFSGWVLPPITFVWALVLILTHIGGTSPMSNRQSYVRVQVPDNAWAENAVKRKVKVQTHGYEVNPSTQTGSSNASIDARQDGYGPGQHDSDMEQQGYGSGHDGFTPEVYDAHAAQALEERNPLHQQTEYRGAHGY